MMALCSKYRCLAQEKLRDTRGFMIGEQLVSIIFLGLLCMVVAAGTGAAMNSYAAVTQVATAQSLTNDAVARINDELQFAREPLGVLSGKDGMTFVRAKTNKTVTLTNDSAKGDIVLKEGGATVVSTLATPSGVLVPTLRNVVYNPNKTWTYTIDIMKRDATATGPGVSIKSTTITCQQIG
ncbi:MAG: hypothetical protein RRX88_06720, partial [Raoultibacter sp.]